ncbi:salutaridinol 7-O-acetyltransferase-like protein [Carex littledalei]|uniref:Salutaridinol 7-O-acetyltransferase-like protein n=1 Tax=Carex littledalei TaxID=544730 RepID=A0A833R4G3_9POAL|nr:salutaridinol 7-O-acetyltransferase-like protein [Carex littledalei]
MKAQQMWDEREEKGTQRVDFIFSSWCRMGWYECDFGFEEPIWVACGITAQRNVCILIDAKDGHGMDVWLWMAVDEMERVESDHEFIKFVSSS